MTVGVTGRRVASRKAAGAALASREVVQRTSRLLALSLSRKSVLKVLPVIGVLLAAKIAYEIVRDAADSMHLIGGRELALSPQAR